MRSLPAVLLAVALAPAPAAWAAGASLDTQLSTLAQEWAAAKRQAHDKRRRKAAIGALIEQAEAFRKAHPRDAAAHAWEGIVLSIYAGEVGALGAMKYADAAREALHRAEALDPTALGGGIYASLGVLYSRVPGGLVGFGDDELAEEYFRKALAIDPDNVYASFFYGQFLLDRGDRDRAVGVLERALQAPPAMSQSELDAQRRAEIRALLREATAESAG